jgi:hypothetical protein
VLTGQAAFQSIQPAAAHSVFKPRDIRNVAAVRTGGLTETWGVLHFGPKEGFCIIDDSEEEEQIVAFRVPRAVRCEELAKVVPKLVSVTQRERVSGRSLRGS